ncbi:MAG TPA: histidine kinase dimerization/phospho-acceptor domain-containing protein, partial [Polyangiaceae bacterium]
MRSIRIRWLLLGVSAAVLVLPALSLVGLRSYTGYLVRRTEEQLLGQAVLISEIFRATWLRENGLAGKAPGSLDPPRIEPWSERSLYGAPRYAQIELLAETISELSPAEPATLPRLSAEGRQSAAFRAARAVEPLLRRAQANNLSAVRVLDGQGCVVATTRGDAERCLGELPEVKRALGGRYAAVLRARVSDEPPPALTSISRRGDRRVFIALPVLHEGNVIAVVRLSRTAESGLEWIWKNRQALFFGTGLVIGAGLLLSLICASLIARPLERMAKAAGAVTATGAAFPEEVVGRAPRELALLGDALRAMTERLARRAEYVAEFAANVSHELKTPLTSIRGAAELLREQWQNMSPEQRERFLANIQADSLRTEALARDLLQLARIENPPASAETPALRLAEFAEALRLRYPENVEVTLAGPDAAVEIPPDHLDSAVGNLVDNALRHRQVEPV